MKPVVKNYQKELDGALALANLAGTVMMHYYDLDYKVDEKEDEATPEAAIFTEVDGKIDDIVQHYFRTVWPDDALLTEETDPEGGWYKSKRVWIVDPIDGTFGYKNKNGAFGISIALVEEGRPVVGVITMPSENITAWSVKGEGSWVNNKQVDMSVVNKVTDLVCSSNSINRPEYKEFIATIDPDKEYEYHAIGSIVVKGIWLLQNVGQLYPVAPKGNVYKSVPKFWDIAATDLLIEEAGGIVTDANGNTYMYNIPQYECVNGVIMGTKEGHKLAMEKLQHN